MLHNESNNMQFVKRGIPAALHSTSCIHISWYVRYVQSVRRGVHSRRHCMHRGGRGSSSGSSVGYITWPFILQGMHSYVIFLSCVCASVMDVTCPGIRTKLLMWHTLKSRTLTTRGQLLILTLMLVCMFGYNGKILNVAFVAASSVF